MFTPPSNDSNYPINVAHYVKKCIGQEHLEQCHRERLYAIAQYTLGVRDLRLAVKEIASFQSHICPLWGMTNTEYCVQTPVEQHTIIVKNYKILVHP
jgi:hypothetical protein